MHRCQQVNAQKALTGAFFTFAGIFFVATAWRELEIGTAAEMGPGYLPLALSGFLIFLGVLTIASAFRDPLTAHAGRIGWRGPAHVAISLVFFGLTIKGLGFVASLTTALFIASFASPTMTLARAISSTLAISVFCYIVFVVALGVPLRPFGPWLAAVGG